MTLPAPAGSTSEVAAAREIFRKAGYDAQAIQSALGTSGDVVARSAEFPVYVRRLAGGGSFEALARLFVLGVAEPLVAAERALSPTVLHQLDALGLVVVDADEVLPVARVLPHDDLLVASDLPDPDGGFHDRVPGVHRPSAALGHLTVRRRVEAALDVGTGSGIQAILVSRHSERVVATDVNPRALAYAAFNAALNGVGNVELREGSLLEPVRGERFGLVVCNPPYVVSPDTEYVFRDSGLGRDRVSEEVIRGIPEVLDEDGFASAMVSWIQPPDEPEPRARGWIEGSGVDAWILRTRTADPLDTAALWNRDWISDPEAYASAIDRWVEWYRQEGIEALAYAAVVMRRRAAQRNWIQWVDLPARVTGPAGSQLERLFSAQDLLEALPDEEALLDEPLVVADGAVLTQRLRPGEGGWETRELSLALADGLPFTAELDAQAAALVTALEQGRPLRAAVEALAESAGVAEVEVRGEALRLARAMLEAGFLTRPEGVGF